MKNLGLYIHIPFCNKKCDYCDFVSFSLNEEEQKKYQSALFKEIDLYKPKFKDKTFNSIFIGGGTPSVMFNGFILQLINKLKTSFNITKNCEFTLEANPKSFTEQKLKEYVASGVNRISLGVQSLDENVIKTINRNQTNADVYSAFKILKNANFKNINADVIVGLPNQNYKSILKTISYLKPRVQHLSVYGLQLENGTPLYKKVQRRELNPMPDDEVAICLEKIAKNLRRSGFNQYEISNFAKPNFQCKHNIKYWDGTNYLGLGLSAHSYIDGTRFWNTSNLNGYYKSLKESRLPIMDSETLTTQQKIEERIMLALRTEKGLKIKQFEKEFGKKFLENRKNSIKNLKKLKKIEIKNGFLKIPNKNFYISNAIILQLI